MSGPTARPNAARRPDVFAVEAGGTSTRVAIQVGPTTTRYTLGSVNPASAGAGTVRDRWDEIFGRVASAAGQTAVGWIATASVGGPDAAAALAPIRASAQRAGLRGRILVSNDVVPLLLAPPLNGNGFVLVAGTGSACLAAAPGRPAVRVGGHEYLLSDEGSGYQLGLAGLRAALRAVEGTGPETLLAAGRRDLPALGRRLATSAEAKTEVAEFATRVIAGWADGDPVATAIVSAGADDLVQLVAAASERLGSPPSTVLLNGSLGARSRAYAELVTERLRRRRPGLPVLVHEDALPQSLALATDPPPVETAGVLARYDLTLAFRPAEPVGR